jgi:hypothetical protein
VVRVLYLTSRRFHGYYPWASQIKHNVPRSDSDTGTYAMGTDVLRSNLDALRQRKPQHYVMIDRPDMLLDAVYRHSVQVADDVIDIDMPLGLMLADTILAYRRQCRLAG